MFCGWRMRMGEKWIMMIEGLAGLRAGCPGV